MVQSLESLIKSASEFTSDKFNIDVHRSQLKPYSDEDWKRFCEMNGFDRNASGLYVPESHSAYVNVESPFLASNIMHELYGHGLFCEHSLMGDELMKGEKTRGQGLFDTVMADYEGFAVWMERTLDEAIGMGPLWEKKKDSMPEYYAQLDDIMRQVEQKVTWLGIFGSLSMPKHYDEEDISKLLDSIHDDHIYVAVLFGSQRPYSDIDIFTVSETGTNSTYNHWLDLSDLSLEQFEYRVKMFDVPVSEALFSGEVISGDPDFAVKYKNKLQSQPITEEAIKYNKYKAEQQNDIADDLEDSRMKKQAGSFADTYQMNAELLSKGVRPLTRENIYDLYKS